MVSLKDVWKSSKGVFGILGLQFSTFDLSEKLMFLDIALFGVNWFDSVCMGDGVDLLCGLHEETRTTINNKMWDLKKSDMIEGDDYAFRVPELYREFAEWYVTERKLKGLRNLWRVFQTVETSLRGNSLMSWSDLVRLRIFDFTAANAKLVASKAMQQLSNLEVLQLYRCSNMTVLKLKGLDCLRHLELVGLTKLVTIPLPGNSTTCEYAGMYDSLRYVLLRDLDSLTHVPDFKSCTSLHTFVVHSCSELRDFEGVECPDLRVLRVWQLVPHQFERLPNFRSLQALVGLDISADSNFDWCKA